MALEEFIKECQPPPKRKDFEQDSAGTGRSAFTVSEHVMKKIVEKTDDTPAPGTPKEPSMWKEFSQQEEKWRKIEQKLESAHDLKVGTDPGSIDMLAGSAVPLKCVCAGGYPVAECIDKNLEMPLQCRNLIMDYIKCVRKYTQNYLQKMVENDI